MSDYTGRTLTAKQKVQAIHDEGVARTYMDSYWFLVDTGDITESDSLYRWCLLADTPSK